MITIHTHLDGTPYHHDLYEVVIICAAGRVRQRAAARAIPEIQPSDEDEPEKPCNHCGKSFPLHTYAKHTTNRDRRDGRCTACKRAYDARRREKMREAAGGRG